MKHTTLFLLGFFILHLANAQTEPELVLPVDSANEITYANFSPDGKRIITISVNEVTKIWDVSSGKILFCQKGGRYSIFPPEGNRVVVEPEMLVNLETGKLISNIESGFSSWSPLGNMIATIPVMSDNINIWESKTGTLFCSLYRHSNAFRSSWSPDEKMIATDTYSGDSTKIWNAELCKLLYDLEGFSASWSPDGNMITTFCGYSDSTKIWNGRNGKLHHVIAGSAASWSPDGKKIVTVLTNNSASIWDSESGSLLYNLEGHTAYILSVIWSPDGSKLLTIPYCDRRGGGDSIAKIWDSKSGALLLNLEDHDRWLIRNIWSPDGETVRIAIDNKINTIDIATGKLIQSIDLGLFYGSDINYKNNMILSKNMSKIKLCHLSTGKELLQFIQIGSSDFVVLHPDGYFDGTPDALKKLYFKKDSIDIPLQVHLAQYYRPDLWKKVMNGEVIK